MASAVNSGRAWTGAEKVSRVVRKRHPTFSFLCLPALLALLIFCCCGAGAAQDPAKGYRLAGTVAVGQSYIAFLEMPDGGQVLVRAGSEVAGARVLEITAAGLRLGLASGVVDLSLEGTGSPQAIAPSAAISSAVDDDKHRVYTRNVSEEHLSRELTAKAGPGMAKPSGNPQLVAAQRIAAVLDLPKNSTVVRVEGQEVSSAEQAIRELQSAFASSAGVVTLDVKTPSGPGRVYLMSERN
jgi:hypothetical protein